MCRLPWRQGEGNVAMNAPRLSGQGGWYLERQLRPFKQGAARHDEKDMFGKMMAPMAATLPDDTAIADVVGLYRGLPDAPVRPRSRVMWTRAASATRCAPPAMAPTAAVRGDQRPGLEGMSDWYMARQLKHFKDGVRGGHPQDIYGAQMALIAGMLGADSTACLRRSLPATYWPVTINLAPR